MTPTVTLEGGLLSGDGGATGVGDREKSNREQAGGETKVMEGGRRKRWREIANWEKRESTSGPLLFYDGY